MPLTLRASLGHPVSGPPCLPYLPYRFALNVVDGFQFKENIMTAPLRRDCIVTSVRLSASEHEAFAAAALRLKESRAHLLRRAVREIIGKPGDLFERELWGLGEAVYQLGGVRRKINQI